MRFFSFRYFFFNSSSECNEFFSMNMSSMWTLFNLLLLMPKLSRFFFHFLFPSRNLSVGLRQWIKSTYNGKQFDVPHQWLLYTTQHTNKGTESLLISRTESWCRKQIQIKKHFKLINDITFVSENTKLHIFWSFCCQFFSSSDTFCLPLIVLYIPSVLSPNRWFISLWINNDNCFTYRFWTIVWFHFFSTWHAFHFWS